MVKSNSISLNDYHYIDIKAEEMMAYQEFVNIKELQTKYSLK